MNTTPNPLDALLTDDAATNREQLAALVGPFVKIVKDSKEFEFLPAFSKLDNSSKVEIMLAASKARALLFDETDGLAPSEIIATQVMTEGSTKSAIKSLFDGRKIKKNKEGKKYILPPYRIPELVEKFIKSN
ncbi:MAG TPA: hypothetical protein VJA87_03710 [Candidatus Paceibacterota bacterium]